MQDWKSFHSQISILLSGPYKKYIVSENTKIVLSKPVVVGIQYSVMERERERGGGVNNPKLVKQLQYNISYKQKRTEFSAEQYLRWPSTTLAMFPSYVGTKISLSSDTR